MTTSRAILVLCLLVPASAYANSTSAGFRQSVKQVVDADIYPAIDASVSGQDADFVLEVAANTQFIIRERSELVSMAEVGSVAALPGIDDADEIDDVAHTVSRGLDREQTTGSAGRLYDLEIGRLVEFLVMRPSESGWAIEITYTILPASL